MMKYTNKNKFIQYQLWQDCSIGCRFCCNKGQPKTNKIESLNFVLNKLDDPEVNDYNEIGLIGGEFFDRELEDKEVRKLFYQLVKKILFMDNITTLYITTSLIFDMNKYLIPFLEYFKTQNKLDKLYICTSYDLKYRFYTKEREDMWKNNMKYLNNQYPQIKLHVETIVTQFFIDAVLNNEFSITDFCKEYNTHIDYIEPSSGFYYYDKKECSKDIPDFFPTKSSFIKFLIKSINAKEINIDTFLSMELRSDKLYYLEGNDRLIVSDRRNGDGFCEIPKKDRLYEIGFIDSCQTMKEIVALYREMENN